MTDQEQKLIEQAYKFDEVENYQEAYELWEDLALEYNNATGWAMLGNYLYEGKGWKSIPASLFCRIKNLRSDDPDSEVSTELLNMIKEGSIVVEDEKNKKKIIKQLKDIDDWVVEGLDEDNYEKKLNKMLDKLEDLIYGDNKPESLWDDFEFEQGD